MASEQWERRRDEDWARHVIAAELIQQRANATLLAERAEDAEHGYRLRYSDRTFRDRVVAGAGVVDSSWGGTEKHPDLVLQFKAYRILPEPTEPPISCHVSMEERAGVELLGTYDSEAVARAALGHWRTP